MCLFFINVFVHARAHTHTQNPALPRMGASLEGLYPPWIFDCIIKITNLLKKLFKHPWARAANQKAWVIIYTLYTITQTHAYTRAHTGSDDAPERVGRRRSVSVWGQDTAAAAAPNKLKIYNHLRLSLSLVTSPSLSSGENVHLTCITPITSNYLPKAFWE